MWACVCFFFWIKIFIYHSMGKHMQHERLNVIQMACCGRAYVSNMFQQVLFTQALDDSEEYHFVCGNLFWWKRHVGRVYQLKHGSKSFRAALEVVCIPNGVDQHWNAKLLKNHWGKDKKIKSHVNVDLLVQVQQIVTTNNNFVLACLKCPEVGTTVFGVITVRRGPPSSGLIDWSGKICLVFFATWQ